MSNKLIILYNYLKHREVNKFKSVDEVKAYQQKGIQKLLKHLNKKSTYYHKILSVNNDFKSLPIMDKVTMMENFDDLVCVDISKEEAFKIAIDSEKSRDFKGKMRGITVGLSSGTSNHRGIFLASQKEADVWTGTILARMLPKMSDHHEIAFFLRANSNLYENVKTRKIGFSYYDIYQPMIEHIIKLSKTQPDILIAPPSVLMIIADAIYYKKLSIQVDKIISVAEVLEDKDRDYFIEQFKVKTIHQVYQCTEGFLGYTCEYGTLHINEDSILIEEEAIDDERFIPIVTDFSRRSQPIVRYRLNDILVHKKELCPCGCHFMALERIEGREDDVFIFTDKNGEEAKLFPDIIRRSVLYVDGIKNYEVIQIREEAIQINLDYDTRNKIDLSQNNLIQQNLIDEFAKISKLFNLNEFEIVFKDYQHTTDKKMKRVRRL